MAGSPKVSGVKPDVLRACREQMGLEIEDVLKKAPKIAEIEKGTHPPTFKCLAELSELYCVPDWVFISEEIPKEFRLEEIPAFRQFVKRGKGVFDHKARTLVVKTKQLRELILELREDMDEAIADFVPPKVTPNEEPSTAAEKIRKWLGVGQEAYDFQTWKEKIEAKEVFVFMTSKYKGWSHIESIRGMAIYHSSLPTIIINDKDSRKAQSFTLFHELAHLSLKKSDINNWQYDERWCDEFAGNVLMPESEIKKEVYDVRVDDLDLRKITKVAKVFEASTYACLVRLYHLGKISKNTYRQLESGLKKKYEQQKQKMKSSPGGPPRKRSEEVLKQYGGLYTRTLFQAYYNKEISLHKLCPAFGLRVSQVLELQHLLK